MPPDLRALRMQLESIRSSADAALAMMGGVEEKEQRRVGPCEHKDLKDISSFGRKRFLCKDCGEIVEERPACPDLDHTAEADD